MEDEIIIEFPAGISSETLKRMYSRAMNIIHSMFKQQLQQTLLTPTKHKGDFTELRDLLKASVRVFNELENLNLRHGGKYKNTYQLAAEIDKVLKQYPDGE